MWLLHHLCVLQYVAFFLLLVEGVRDTAGGEGVHEGGKVSKRSKPVDLDEGGHDNEDYYYEDVDERNNPTNEAPVVPPGFLSPSVREYLDLGKSIPGRAGTDYPVLGKVPYTNFYCDDQPYPGFFADVETRCQAWHYCDIDGRQATFLCPNVDFMAGPRRVRRDLIASSPRNCSRIFLLDENERESSVLVLTSRLRRF
ncbi:uncharacterized protein LOC143265784 isoform X5 [Megachile rotundata]|uniref:uncharacterized protein LOC143265784 isoform X5 n=1 Tax=Megachile rotundata TaxID=143995 RepID=UPI003FD2D2F3